MIGAGTARPAIEIAVQDPAGAAVAAAAGADRVELCSALSTGGLTPSIGAVLGAVDAAAGTAAVQVLIRPRPGGFVYDARELTTMVRDIRALRDTGIGGVVVGAMTSDRRIDSEVTAELVAAADGLDVTFHRAIDTALDQLESIEVLVGLGVTRVLTSGGARRSIDALAVLAAIQRRAAGRLEVMAGGGVRVDDIAALLGAGLAAVHLSARHERHDPSPSGPGGGDGLVERTDPETVAAAVAARDANQRPESQRALPQNGPTSPTLAKYSAASLGSRRR